jgi:23S rRNA (adenine2030-N6)-methyltransferase
MECDRDYDHRSHAGNAGDLWKHLILALVADYLLSREDNWIYVESHAGYPLYLIEERGEWEGGIGRIWHLLPKLLRFPSFGILSWMNPGELKVYPGSATSVMEIARRKNKRLKSELWDKNPLVERAWSGCDQYREVSFHLGDGFSGVDELIEDIPSALLLIDPPYLEESDLERSVELFCRAVSRGWTVLLWYMMNQSGDLDPGCESSTYELVFGDVGLLCGRWKGAHVAMGGGDDLLKKHLDLRGQEFQRILQDQKIFKNGCRN